MAEGCNLFLDGDDIEKIRGSLEGEQPYVDPEIVETNKSIIETAIKENIEKIIPASYTVLGKEIRILPQLHSESEVSQSFEKLRTVDPDKTILITKKGNAFLNEWERGWEKNYPKNLPKVEEAARILPTLRNLVRMVNGHAPFDENGEKLELHHYAQKMKGPLVLLDSKEHDFREYHDPKKESEIDHNKYKRQRETFWKWWAESYLGKDLAKVLYEQYKDKVADSTLSQKH